MVLADNQKEEAPNLQFVREVKYQKKYADLFGDNGTDDLGTSFHLAAEDDNVWDNPIAWQQIYAPQKKNAGVRNEIFQSFHCVRIRAFSE